MKMQYLLLFLTFSFLSILIGKFVKHKSLYPFMPFRYDFRKRRDSFQQALNILGKSKAKVIVETGTSREGLKGAKVMELLLLYLENGQN